MRERESCVGPSCLIYDEVFRRVGQLKRSAFRKRFKFGTQNHGGTP